MWIGTKITGAKWPRKEIYKETKLLFLSVKGRLRGTHALTQKRNAPNRKKNSTQRPGNIMPRVQDRESGILAKAKGTDSICIHLRANPFILSLQQVQHHMIDDYNSSSCLVCAAAVFTAVRSLASLLATISRIHDLNSVSPGACDCTGTSMKP